MHVSDINDVIGNSIQSCKTVKCKNVKLSNLCELSSDQT